MIEASRALAAVRDVADVDRAGFALLRTARVKLRRLRSREQGTRIRKEGSPRIRQAHHSSRPFQKLYPQLIFQRLDLVAQRRLGDVQPLGSPAEVQFLGHGDKVSKMPQFHPFIITTSYK